MVILMMIVTTTIIAWMKMRTKNMKTTNMDEYENHDSFQHLGFDQKYYETPLEKIWVTTKVVLILMMVVMMEEVCG
jgi:hypothetical protein